MCWTKLLHVAGRNYTWGTQSGGDDETSGGWLQFFSSYHSRKTCIQTDTPCRFILDLSTLRKRIWCPAVFRARRRGRRSELRRWSLSVWTTHGTGHEFNVEIVVELIYFRQRRRGETSSLTSRCILDQRRRRRRRRRQWIGRRANFTCHVDAAMTCCSVRPHTSYAPVGNGSAVQWRYIAVDSVRPSVCLYFYAP